MAIAQDMNFGILLPKLFWHTVRRNCSRDGEKFYVFEDESREFAQILRSLEQFIQPIFGNRTLFPGGFSDLIN